MASHTALRERLAEKRAAMKPRIQGTQYGWITVDEVVHERDILIRPSGKVKKRKWKLSRKDGSSHVISLEEAKHIFGKGAVEIRRHPDVFGRGKAVRAHAGADEDALAQKAGVGGPRGGYHLGKLSLLNKARNQLITHHE